MEPMAKMKRVFKANPSKIADDCLRTGIFSNGFCPMNGSMLPVVTSVDKDDDYDTRRAKDASDEKEILITPSNNSELYTTQPMRSLTVDEYAQVFKSFLDHSTEHQCMEQFNTQELPNIVASLGNGNSTINVLGVGSGTGEQDLKMIRIIQSKHPGTLIINEVIEPNQQHILAYKDAVRNSSDLKNVFFTWHQLTSMEYENQVKEHNMQKKYDFIHLIQFRYEQKASAYLAIFRSVYGEKPLVVAYRSNKILGQVIGTCDSYTHQNMHTAIPVASSSGFTLPLATLGALANCSEMLYRVEDIANTIKFFHSCLDRYAKLLIIISSGESGWAAIWKKYRDCLPPTDSGHYVTADDIKVVLEGMGVNYQVYDFPSDWDITECFIDGDTVGGYMLDFLTGTKDFMNTAPLDLKQRLRHALGQPECSAKKDGRVIFRNDLSMIVVNC